MPSEGFSDLSYFFKLTVNSLNWNDMDHLIVRVGVEFPLFS